MTTVQNDALAPKTAGITLHRGARYYDVMAWLMTMGREKSFRGRLLDLACVKPGESVLDVGCGTGTLAVVAKRRVGSAGSVHGIDASPEMITVAKRKAHKAGLDIAFQNQAIEATPFADGRFDVVMSTLMFHHLPRKTREQGAREMRRILKRGGRALVVDFGLSAARPKGLLAHFHHRHGSVSLEEIVRLLNDAGLKIVENGPVGIEDLNFVLASAPCCA